jgi:hypothetical protein
MDHNYRGTCCQGNTLVQDWGAHPWYTMWSVYFTFLGEESNNMTSDEISDREAIRDLKARYFRLLDTKDWEGWSALFSTGVIAKSDMAVSTGGADGKTLPACYGAVEFVTRTREVIDLASTVHHGHTPEITCASDTEAWGIWAMEDIVEWPDGRILRGYGHYHETYCKEPGGWRITSLHLTRTRVDLSGPWGDD